ncbi:hypothetical protein ACQWU4_08610 [Chryseobacterium sp. MIQD13]
MKKNTNVPKAYAACIYKDPVFSGSLKRNTTELTGLGTGTFIF